MADFYEYSTPELVRLLGSRFKEYRMRCNLTQKDALCATRYDYYFILEVHHCFSLLNLNI